MPLPTKPQTRVGMPPRRARVMLAAPPKAGKTTLLGNWAPQTTLLVDTHNGTMLLDGEHYVAHVADWPQFVRVIDDVVKGGHSFHTIGLDLLGDLWRFCDLHHGKVRDGLRVPASGMDDYGRSNARSRATFMAQVGRLLAAPVGVWFIAHLREKSNKEGELTGYAPDVDKAIYGFVMGAVDFVWLAEVLPDGRRVVHTMQTEHFEAGSRFPLPSPLDMSAGVIALAMDRGLNPGDYGEDGSRKRPEPEPEVVPPTPEIPPVADTPPERRDIERTGKSDLPNGDSVWWDATEARLKALGMDGKGIRAMLTEIGFERVPEKVSSWRNVLLGLNDTHRASLNHWLLEREQAGTPFA